MALRGMEDVEAGLARPSGWLLVAVNLAVLVAVLHFGWSAFDIIFLYWAENLVIGAINVLKMITASSAHGTVDPNAAPLTRSQSLGVSAVGCLGKLFLIPFFIVHYGGFCFGHGMLIIALFERGGGSSQDPLEVFGEVLPEILTGGIAVSLALLAASHLYSFVVNYLGSGEFRRTDPAQLMMRPYGRIVALHITIIAGGFLSGALGDPTYMLVVLVVLKTGVDLAMHGRERRKYLNGKPGPVTA